jgi:hypothetical protein
VTPAVSASVAERSPTEIGDSEMNDLDRLAASFDALAFLSQSDVEEADFGDGHGEASTGGVVTKPIGSTASPGAFEPSVIGAMSVAA